jgi:hypothetical protein
VDVKNQLLTKVAEKPGKKLSDNSLRQPV